MSFAAWLRESADIRAEGTTHAATQFDNCQIHPLSLEKAIDRLRIKRR
jgi:hypothetical protein